MLILGYIFLLKDIEGKSLYKSKHYKGNMAHEGVYATLVQYAARCGANVKAATQVEAWVNQT